MGLLFPPFGIVFNFMLVVEINRKWSEFIFALVSPSVSEVGFLHPLPTSMQSICACVLFVMNSSVSSNVLSILYVVNFPMCFCVFGVHYF